MDPLDPQPDPVPEPLDTSALTWAVLLARWTEFAQAAVALRSGPGEARWRASVPGVIALQAVTMALGEAERLPEREVGLAVDRGEVLVARHSAEIHGAWRGEAMPHGLHELLHDAHCAVARAKSIGVEWVVGVERLEMPALDEWVARAAAQGHGGEILAAPAGTVLFRGEPAVFARPGGLDDPGEMFTRRVSVPRQVFRQVSEDGLRAERDLVVAMEASLVPGRPLLVAWMEGGRVLHRTDAASAERWVEMQRRVMERGAPVVEFS